MSNSDKKIIHPCLHQNPYMDYVKEYLHDLARKSTCERSKGASIIVVKNIEIIGEGYNSRPCNVAGKCTKDDVSALFKSDKTCCVHAEQRAIMDALERNADQLTGSTIYYLRLDQNEIPVYAGEPYCTICSKMALDAGISKFVLYLKQGWTDYDTDYYNNLSFNYGKITRI